MININGKKCTAKTKAADMILTAVNGRIGNLLNEIQDDYCEYKDRPTIKEEKEISRHLKHYISKIEKMVFDQARKRI
jgi:hypothetical protein